MSNKKVEVCPAVGKEKFDYRCPICDKWRPLLRYEPINEARSIRNDIAEGMEIPKDEQRFFIGPVCGAECLRQLEANKYKIVELDADDE